MNTGPYLARMECYFHFQSMGCFGHLDGGWTWFWKPVWWRFWKVARILHFVPWSLRRRSLTTCNSPMPRGITGCPWPLWAQEIARMLAKQIHRQISLDHRHQLVTSISSVHLPWHLLVVYLWTRAFQNQSWKFGKPFRFLKGICLTSFNPLDCADVIAFSIHSWKLYEHNTTSYW